MKNLKLKKFNLKKLFFTVSIFVIFNISAFAKNGFEFILNVPIGGSYSIISQNIKDYGMKNSIGLDAGIEAQLGGMFQVKENFAINVLGDIGFVHDIYAVKFKNDYYLKDYYAYVKLTFDYSIFFTDKVAMNIGLYFGYDFLPNEEIIITSSGNYEQIYTEIPKNYGTFNFGVQLGLRFGPKV